MALRLDEVVHQRVYCLLLTYRAQVVVGGFETVYSQHRPLLEALCDSLHLELTVTRLLRRIAEDDLYASLLKSVEHGAQGGCVIDL